MMSGVSHCGAAVSPVVAERSGSLLCSVVALVSLAWVSSGSGAGSSCGCSQGASLRVVPSARRVVGVFARLVLVGVVVFVVSVAVAVGAGGIVLASLAFVLLSSASLASALVLVSVAELSAPLVALSRGVVSCPVSPRAMVWSAAACSWMARLARSMSPLARASACASAIMVSAFVRASLMMRSASLRASLMMVSACSRACWSAFSRAAVMSSRGLCVVSLLFMIVPFLTFLLFVCVMWLRRHRGFCVRVRWRRGVAIALFR